MAWVTAGLNAPGVRLGSGSPGNRSAEPPAFVGATMPVASGANEAPALAAASSSVSALDAPGEAPAPEVETVALADAKAVRFGNDVSLVLAEAFAATKGVDVLPAADGLFPVDPDTLRAAI